MKMRLIGLSLLFLSALATHAQNHALALSGGTSYIFSIASGENPIGLGSPFEARLGTTFSFEYSYIFKRKLYLNLRTNYSRHNFFDEDAYAFNQETGDVEVGNLDLNVFLFTNSIGIGQLFDLSEIHSMGFEAGATLFYFYKEISESEQVENSRLEIDLDWGSDNLFLGAYLENNHYFQLYNSGNTSLQMLVGLRATMAFKYLTLPNNSPRMVPELFIGIQAYLK